jgi:signal transduction histidine kinase
MTPTDRPLPPISNRTVAIVATVAASVLALIIASQTYLSMLSHGHSFVRLFVWQFLSFSFWALLAPWIVAMAQRRGYLALAALALALSAAHLLIAAELIRWLQPLQPIQTYDTFGQALSATMPYQVLSNPIICLVLIVGGRAMGAYERARQLQLRESQLESELAKAQLDALRLEIEPHFLFNTLNSIAALIRINDNAAALSMLLRLSELMRSTLDRTAGHFTPLSDELGIVTRYVDLHRERFGDRLNVVYSVDDSCGSVPVPSFLLQPLVENALRHGLGPSARQGRLEIGAAASAAGTMTLWVSDDGRGLPPGFDATAHTGTGLRNVRARLARIYGNQARFTLTRDQAGLTRAEIVLPAAAAPVAATA